MVTDREAVELLNLLNQYVQLPDSDENVGALSISDVAADLLESLPDEDRRHVDALDPRLGL